jgi:hypothetical protein
MSSMRTLAIDDFTAASITSWNHPAEKCGVCVREGMQHSYTTQYIHRYLCSFYYFPVPHLSATSCTLGSFTYLLCIVTSLSSFSVVWCNTNLQIGQAKKSYIPNWLKRYYQNMSAQPTEQEPLVFHWNHQQGNGWLGGKCIINEFQICERQLACSACVKLGPISLGKMHKILV